MRIKVVEVGPVSKNKTFFEFNLKFEVDGKTQDKKMFSFNEASYKALKDAAAGTFYEVKLEKDKNGYWQWVEVTKVEGPGPATASGSGGGSRGFETPEERARRQVLIVRQSCLAQAVAVFARGDAPINLDEVVDTAARFEDWVSRE